MTLQQLELIIEETLNALKNDYDVHTPTIGPKTRAKIARQIADDFAASLGMQC